MYRSPSLSAVARLNAVLISTNQSTQERHSSHIRTVCSRVSALLFDTGALWIRQLRHESYVKSQKAYPKQTIYSRTSPTFALQPNTTKRGQMSIIIKAKGSHDSPEKRCPHLTLPHKPPQGSIYCRHFARIDHVVSVHQSSSSSSFFCCIAFFLAKSASAKLPPRLLGCGVVLLL